MAITNIENGDLICQSGEPLKELYVIGEGTVRADFPGGELVLRKGDIIGIQDIKTGKHSCTYTAMSAVALVPYPFGSMEQLLTLLQSKPNVLYLFLSAGARFSNALLGYCAEIEERLSDASLNDGSLSEDDMSDLGLSGETVYEEEEELDLPDSMPEDDDTEIPAELEDALEVILEYGKCDEELASSFIYGVESYRKLRDRDSTDDDVRALRNKLTTNFYKVYAHVFEQTLDSTSPTPAAVKLFLYFGFVDAKIAGAANSAYLLSIMDTWHGDPDNGIFTYYEWLAAIYYGEREPSRNEFDLDYPAYLRELKKNGDITARDEKSMLDSAIDKVYFEMENVFPIVNKMTFGRISTFCPIFSSHNVIKPLSDILVTPKKVRSTFRAIREVDFSAYYRETAYSDERAGVTREFIDVEVIPDVILLPNVGVRGAMWQEIEGKRRTTPARMLISALALEDLFSLFLRMTGEFRWEMCKRIQGAHWNNIAERSLTSEYFDYVQFYRKNHDLSPEAKEKIKLNLQRSKNSIKEMFIRDYITWVNFEAKGAPHLNKIARGILFTYCPFPAELRSTLTQHPLYSDYINRYTIKQGQFMHRLENVCSKITKMGYDIPDEIKAQIEFIKK